jgi:RNA polymerase sigma-70 factor (ECF subfamily)
MTPESAIRDDDWSQLLTIVGQTQDRQAFARVFEHYAPLVKGFCLSKPVPNQPPNLAEELVQETMFKVWTKAPYFNPTKAAASTWVYTIARNSRIDYLRRANKIKADISADDLWAVSEEPEPYTYLEQDKTSITVNEAITHLPEEQSDVVRQIFMEGRSHSEVSAATGIPLGTVKSRSRLAMKRLRNILQKPELID